MFLQDINASSALPYTRLLFQRMAIDYQGSDISCAKAERAYNCDRSVQNGDKGTGPMLLVWSATQEKAVSRMVQGYDKWREARLSSKLRSAGELEQLAFTLAARRSYLPWRTFSIAGNSWPAAGFSTVKPVRAQENPAMALVFTGQGAQYSGMGMGLLRYPVFKTTLSKADDVFRDLQCEWSLFGEYRGTPLAPNERRNKFHLTHNADIIEDRSEVAKPEFSQPLCTALQIACYELLKSLGVRPSAVVGHSSGEIAAA